MHVVCRVHQAMARSAPKSFYSRGLNPTLGSREVSNPEVPSQIACKELQEAGAGTFETLQYLADRQILAEMSSTRGSTARVKTNKYRCNYFLLKAIPVHLVVQGPHADAEQLCGPFAVVVAPV